MAASLARGIDWIAGNDEPEDMDAVEVEGYISTQLLAYLFDRPALPIARQIVAERRKMEWWEGPDICECADGGQRTRPGSTRCRCGGAMT